jgi:acetylcholinesterase
MSNSVLLKLIANNGDNQGLFRAAIMESGSPIPTLGASGGENEYQALVNAAGCSQSQNTFTCLQQLPYAQLFQAVSKFILFTIVFSLSLMMFLRYYAFSILL